MSQSNNTNIPVNGANLAGNMSALNMYGLKSSDVDDVNMAIENSMQALKDRYAQPNWFNVAAGFAKPQLGGFTASMGSASQALGDWQEQQRAQQLPIAQMAQQVALNKITMNQNKNAADKLSGIIASGKTPTTTQAMDISATSPDTPSARAVENQIGQNATATGTALAGQNLLPSAGGGKPDISGASTFNSGAVAAPKSDTERQQDYAKGSGLSSTVFDDKNYKNQLDLNNFKEYLKTATDPADIASLQKNIARLQGNSSAETLAPTTSAPVNSSQSTLSPNQQAAQQSTSKANTEVADLSEHVRNNVPMNDQKMQVVLPLLGRIGDILKQPGMDDALGAINKIPGGFTAMAATLLNSGVNAGVNTPSGGISTHFSFPVDKMIQAGIKDPNVRTNLTTLAQLASQSQDLLGDTDAGRLLHSGFNDQLSKSAIKSATMFAGATAEQQNYLQKAKTEYSNRTGDNTMSGFKSSPEQKSALSLAKDRFNKVNEILNPSKDKKQ